MQSATNGPFKVLGDSLRAHPNSQFKKRADLSKLMSTMEYVYPQVIIITKPVRLLNALMRLCIKVHINLILTINLIDGSCH